MLLDTPGMKPVFKLYSKVFDLGSQLYQLRQANEAKPDMPDLSKFPLDHLLSAEDKADPAKFYAPTGYTPELNVTKVTDLLLMEIIDGEFRSRLESPFEENNTVYVKHFRLRGKPGGGPTVIMIHGWRMDDYSYFDWWCWRFAAWGFSSILVNMPYHIKRVPEGSFSGQLLITPESMWSLVSLRQSFMDIEAVANMLKASGAGTLGAFGVSYGATLAGIYLCQYENVDFAVMCMPTVDSIAALKRTDLCDGFDPSTAAGPLLFSDPDVPALFNMCNMMPKVPNDNIFIAYGEFDHLVKEEEVDETARRWGGLPWAKRYPTGHINTFALNIPMILDAQKFIAKFR